MHEFVRKAVPYHITYLSYMSLTENILLQTRNTMEGLVATADASPIELQPTMEDPISNPAQAVGRAPIRNTKLRVANAFKRIRARRAQTNAENEKQPLPPALFRLDEGCRSDVSGITDVGDDLSWYGGDGDSHHRTQRISRSLTPKFPTKTSTDPSLPESIETWREYSIVEPSVM